jgi:hypothetical protein
MDLYQLFKDFPETLASHAFSEFALQEMGINNIAISMDEFEDLYEKAKELCEAFKNEFTSSNLGFIDSGLKFGAKNKAQNREYISLSANAAHMLARIFNNASYPTPSWLPDTFVVDALPGSQHQKTYLFLWSTVQARHIPAHKNDSFIIAVQRFSRTHSIDGQVNPIIAAKQEAKKEPEPLIMPHRPLAENSDLTLLKNTLPISPTDEQIPRIPFEPNADGFVHQDKAPTGDNFDLSTLSINLYTNIIKLCHEKRISITLTIADVYDMVKNEDKCFFTGAKLKKSPTEQMSDMQICLRRKREQIGFSAENTVVCSYQATKVLSSTEGEKRELALETLRKIHSSDVDLELLKMINNL